MAQGPTSNIIISLGAEENIRAIYSSSPKDTAEQNNFRKSIDLDSKS
jgi:hypothetical protein